MTREQQWSLGMFAGGAAFGAALVYVGDAYSVELAVAVCVAGVVIFAGLRWAYIRFLMPRLVRSQMVKLVVADIGPPPESEPIQLELAERFAAALTNMDASAAIALTADGFQYRYAPLNSRANRRRYKAVLKVMNSAYATIDAGLTEARSVPGSLEVAWVLFTEELVPHYGPPLNATWWERWEMNADRTRLLGAELVGVTTVG